jgi:hypothetical protein
MWEEQSSVLVSFFKVLCPFIYSIFNSTCVGQHSNRTISYFSAISHSTGRRDAETEDKHNIRDNRQQLRRIIVNVGHCSELKWQIYKFRILVKFAVTSTFVEHTWEGCPNIWWENFSPFEEPWQRFREWTPLWAKWIKSISHSRGIL